MNKRNLIIALVIPLVVFTGLVAGKQMKVMTGRKIILPIHGFDPRDLLSGHYLIYRIDYGLENNGLCSDRDNNNRSVYICLNKSDDSGHPYISTLSPYDGAIDPADTSCSAVIKGTCKNRSFTAGIEKFYIPEEYAISLDRAVRQGQGEIVLSVSRKGKVAIKDLLIDGKSWKEYKPD